MTLTRSQRSALRSMRCGHVAVKPLYDPYVQLGGLQYKPATIAALRAHRLVRPFRQPTGTFWVLTRKGRLVLGMQANYQPKTEQSP